MVSSQIKTVNFVPDVNNKVPEQNSNIWTPIKKNKRFIKKVTKKIKKEIRRK